MHDKISIGELTSGLVALIDGILDATENEPLSTTGERNINIVDALRMVRDRFDAMKCSALRGECSARDFENGMNAIMADLRSRT
jgi:hypothetical protein